MKHIFLAASLVLILIVSRPSSHAQTPTEVWAQRFHEPDAIENRALAIAVDSKGNSIVTGTAMDTNGFKQWITLAYSSVGAPLWTNRYHGLGTFHDDQPNALAVDAAGNAFVAGVSFSAADDQDYTVIKFSTAGMALWTNHYNGPGNGNDGATAIAINSAGNVLITGLSIGTSGLSSFFDYATIKYSNTGAPIWTNRFNGPANNEDQATDIAVDASGNVFVTGYSFDSAGRSDYVTLAYSASGNPLWTNRYTGPLNGADDYARAIAVDANGNVFVTGESWNGNATDFATIKYSPAGTPIWTNRYHGPLPANNFAAAIAADTIGNVFVTGSDGSFASTNGGYATIKYSNDGMSLWTNHFNAGFTDNARAVSVDPNGNVIVTGQSYRDFITSDVVTVAYSNDGATLWTNRYNGPINGDDVPLTKRSLALGPNDSIYVIAASDQKPSNEAQFDFVTIKYTTSPSLNITTQDGFAAISWPAAFSNFQLQESADLPPANNWSPVAAQSSTNDNSISVTLPATGSRNFFRLIFP